MTVGPLIDEGALAKMERQVTDADRQGRPVSRGGQRLTGDDYDSGHLLRATVLTDVTPEMLIYREETFGPIAPVILFDDEDEVIEMANDTNYGLASYIYTNDLCRALRVSRGAAVRHGRDQRHQPDLGGGPLRRHEGERPGARGRPGGHHGVPGDQVDRYQHRPGWAGDAQGMKRAALRRPFPKRRSWRAGAWGAPPSRPSPMSRRSALRHSAW